MPDVSLSGIEFTIKGNSNAASDSIKNLTNQINKLNAALSKSKSVGNLSNQIKKVGDSAKTASKSMGKLTSSILRIGFYRMIRSGIKGVTDAFREGLQNAYQFSKINGGALAESLDLIATKSLTMKNQLGAAFGTLITAVTPIVLQLISLITRLANALSMLFAALGGQAQYKKAVDVWTEWGEAAGGAGAAAKEALKYLAPFDELNRLPDDKQGGGGGGAATPDFSEMFEYQDLPEWLQHFADKMSELASSLKITFNDVFFDWSDLTGEQIAEKAIVGLSALVGAGVGFMIGGVPGAIVGTLIGAAIGLEISAMTFDHDGVLSRSEIASMVSLALSALCGGVIGFVVGGPGGALIGAALGIGVSGGLKAAEFFSDGKVGNLVEQFATALTVLTGAVIGFTVGGPAGALIGAAIGIGVSAAITGIEFSSSGNGSGWQGLNYFVTEVLGMPTDEEWKQYGRDIWNWIVEGIKDFGTELKNIFIQPIIDAFDGFSLKDLILGHNGDTSDGGNWFSNIFGGSLDLEANVTSVKDSIPEKDKQIDAKANFVSYLKNFTSGSLTSSGNPIINGVANLVYLTKAFTNSDTTSSGNPILNAVANFTGRQLHFSGDTTSGGNPIFKAIANFYGRQLNFSGDTTSGGNPIFKAIANFYGRQLNFSGNVTSGGNPIFSSVANFISRQLNFSGSTTGSGNPIFSAAANFLSWLTGWKSNPDPDATANFTDWDDSIPWYDRPNISCTATVTELDWATNNPGYVMGSGAKGGVWGARGKIADIPQYASGGRVHGSIFLAGEAGAELVGHVGGRTEVLNRSQLAATMYSAVRSAMGGIAFSLSSPSMATESSDDGANEDMLYRAFLRALNDSDVGERPIEIDGSVVYQKMVQRNRTERRRTGVNPMMSY